MSGEQVMVIPGEPPVSINGGPEISTRVDDLCTVAFMEVRVDGELVAVPIPWPEPQPIWGTPYEAYAHADWIRAEFAIRLRTDSSERGASPGDVA